MLAGFGALGYSLGLGVCRAERAERKTSLVAGASLALVVSPNGLTASVGCKWDRPAVRLVPMALEDLSIARDLTDVKKSCKGWG